MAAAWDKDTVSAKVALDLIRGDIAKKYPEAAEALTDDLMERSVKLAKVKNLTPPPDPRFPAQNVSGYCWCVSCACCCDIGPLAPAHWLPVS